MDTDLHGWGGKNDGKRIERLDMDGCGRTRIYTDEHGRMWMGGVRKSEISDLRFENRHRPGPERRTLRISNRRLEEMGIAGATNDRHFAKRMIDSGERCP
jgi:hypothetical protein